MDALRSLENSHEATYRVVNAFLPTSLRAILCFSHGLHTFQSMQNLVDTGILKHELIAQRFSNCQGRARFMLHVSPEAES